MAHDLIIFGAADPPVLPCALVVRAPVADAGSAQKVDSPSLRVDPIVAESDLSV